MNHITRKEAIAQGLKYYFTGIECKYGHISKRQVTGSCYACILARTEQSKAWRLNNPERVKELRSRWCKSKHNERKENAIKWNKNNSSRVKINEWKRKYKLSQEEAESLFSRLTEVCDICKKPERIKTNKGTIKNLAVDHCHQTGKVRGLLCHSCNTALGNFRDSIESLQSAIDYLSR
jgi:hypothetical protein